MTPTSDEIQQQLKRLLLSKGFTNATRMSRFLQFVVDETLKGQADRLKEYVVGVEVFDRNEQYDPRVDSIVRVEASRLRTKILEYYSGPGSADTLVISLPKGRYSPEFVVREPVQTQDEQHQADPNSNRNSPASSTHRSRYLVPSIAFVILLGLVFFAWQTELWRNSDLPVAAPKIRIAVLPFQSTSNAEADQNMARRLTKRVTAELVKIGSLAVVSSTSALQFEHNRGSLRNVAKQLTADLLMEATVIKDGNVVHVETRIIAGAIDQKFLVDDSFVGQEIDELAKDIALATADALKTTQLGRPRMSTIKANYD